MQARPGQSSILPASPQAERRAAPLRRLLPADRAALVSHLLALSPTDRVARWNGGRSDAAIAEECAALDLAPGAPRMLGIGSFGATGELLGAAVGIRLGGDAVEVAVTVAAPWRRRGIGSALVTRLCQEARAEFALCRAILPLEAENVAIQGLVRKIGGVVDLQRGEGVLG